MNTLPFSAHLQGSPCSLGSKAQRAAQSSQHGAQRGTNRNRPESGGRRTPRRRPAQRAWRKWLAGERRPRATWPSAHAPRPMPGAVGACAALPPPPPPPPPHGESRARAILRPPLPSPCHLSLPTLSAPHPAPSQACPGPPPQKPHHRYPHILHAGHAAVPTSVLRAEVVGGVRGAARGGQGKGLGPAGVGGARQAPRLRAPAPVPAPGRPRGVPGDRTGG